MKKNGFPVLTPVGYEFCLVKLEFLNKGLKTLLAIKNGKGEHFKNDIQVFEVQVKKINNLLSLGTIVIDKENKYLTPGKGVRLQNKKENEKILIWETFSTNGLPPGIHFISSESKLVKILKEKIVGDIIIFNDEKWKIKEIINPHELNYIYKFVNPEKIVV